MTLPLLTKLQQARVELATWENDCNRRRPYSGLGRARAAPEQAKLMDVAIVNLYAYMAFAQLAKKGTIDLQNEIKTR